MPTGGIAPLSWRFLVELLSASASSGISSLLVWLDSTVGRTMASISPNDTLGIISISQMFTTRYGVLAELVGEFSVNSIYSEFPSLPPKLAADVTSLSGLAGSLGDAF